MAREDVGVVFGLLQTLGRGTVLGLRRHDGDGEAASVAEDVVGTLRRPADNAVSGGDDAAVRDGPLFRNRVRFVIPAGGNELRHHVLAAGVGFGGVIVARGRSPPLGAAWAGAADQCGAAHKRAGSRAGETQDR